MPYNITIDDLSPLITYKGQWLDSYKLTGDPYTDRYWGESFHSSQTDGAQVSQSALRSPAKVCSTGWYHA
jgi:hypothetical protein